MRLEPKRGGAILFKKVNRIYSKLSNKKFLLFHSHALILIYHRVSDLSSDPQLLSVNPGHFEAHIKYLAENYRPVSLTTLVDIIRNKQKIPRGLVCITFDDGYADNLWNAKPILEKYNVPATVFITTGYVDSDREFWWDDLERILLVPDVIPDELAISIGGEQLYWKNQDRSEKPDNINSDKSVESSTSHITKNVRWDVTLGFFPTPRHQLYIELHRLLKSLSYEEREKNLQNLCEWANVPVSGRPEYRALNTEEIRNLTHGGLIEIGSHTITHTVLSSITDDLLESEILGSKKFLESILNKKITSFSYPFGDHGDFTNNEIEMVKNTEYLFACANYSGPVFIETDPYTLPRFLVRNWNIGIFAQKMKEWYYG